MDGNVFDEVIEFKNLKRNEEAEKDFIPEDLSKREWANYIIKKGTTVQRLAMINRIPFLMNDKEVIEFIFQSIMEYIEIWDDCLQLALAEAIYSIYNASNIDEKVTFLLFFNMSGIIHSLLKFCMKIISTEVSHISDEYTHSLNSLVKFYSNYRKIKLESEVIEYACNMGSFGKTSSCRRFSVYFCSCLVQISEDYLQEVYSRLMILSSDSDCNVRLEWAYHFRFLFQDYLEDKYIQQTLLKSVDSFWDEDDLLQKSEILISILINMDKIKDCDLFLQGIMQRIISLFETYTSVTEHGSLISVIEVIIEKLVANNDFSPSILKTLLNVVKFFIKKHICGKDISNHPKPQIFNTFILNFSKLYSIFQNESIYMNDILKFVMKNISCFKHLSLDNLEHIVYAIPIDDSISTKIISNLIVNFIEGANNGTNTNTIDSDNSSLKIIVKRFCHLLPSLLSKPELISIFYQKFDIFEIAMRNSLNKGWRDAYNFLKAFTLFECQIVFENLDFLKKVEMLVSSLIFVYVSHYQGQEVTFNVNYKIVKVCLKILPFILKYSFKPVREEILKYLEKKIVDDKSFYVRRLYIPFFKKAVNVFSISYLKENMLMELFSRFLDGNFLILPEVFDLIKRIHPMLDDKFKLIIVDKMEQIKNKYHADILTTKSLCQLEKSLNEDDERIIQLLKNEEIKIKEEKSLAIKESAMSEKREEGVKRNKKLAHKKGNMNLNFIPHIRKQANNNINCTGQNNTQNNNLNIGNISRRRGSLGPIEKIKKANNYSLERVCNNPNNNNSKSKSKSKRMTNIEVSSEKVKTNINNIRHIRNINNNNNNLPAFSSISSINNNPINNMYNSNNSNNSNNGVKKRK